MTFKVQSAARQFSHGTFAARGKSAQRCTLSCVMTTTSGKRTRPLTPRRSSTSSIPSGSLSSSTSSPETKIARSSRSPDTSFSNDGVDGGDRPIICTLPPTCNRRPITLTKKELERHYAKYHAHVCEQVGCGCVFPEAKFLELHQTECHDPLAAVRKERGEKIFGCMVTTCTRTFASPKSRRLHLIEVHKYPKEFFFAVTNKGIGGLLRKWGEGVSMIRGNWKPRDLEKKEEGDRMMLENTDEDDKSSSEEVDMEELEKTPKPAVRPLHPDDSLSTSGDTRSNVSPDVDVLAEGMSSLALIPSSIRFGRGSRGGGLGARGRGRGELEIGIPSDAENMSTVISATDTRQAGVNANGTGGKDRGRRRAKGHHGVGGSNGTGMEIDAPSGAGDVVLLSPEGASRTERGRGSSRGKKEDRSHAR